MTVIRPSSISGINSITANGGDINLFRADGTKADVPIVNNITAGVVTATKFVGPIEGSGANLTSIPAAQLTGTVADARISTLTSSKLSGALPALDGSALTGVGVGTADSINTSGIITATSFVPTVGQLSHRNLIINGAMQVAQRGTSSTSSATSVTYQVDRFFVFADATDQASFTHAQVSDAPTGFSKSFKLSVGTAETTLDANETLQFVQRIEAQNLQQLDNGLSTAKSVTLSFYVKSYQTGTFNVNLYKSDNTVRHISATYTVNQSATWEKKTITFAGDTSGGGINDDNGNGLDIYWHLAAGSNFTSADSTSWGNYSAAGFAYGQAVNLMSSTDNYWQITGVQLEVGPVATPFEHRSIGEEFRRCQRYYQQYVNISAVGYVPNNGSRTYSHGFFFPVEMRAAPTMSITNTGSSNGQYITDGSTNRYVSSVLSQGSKTTHMSVSFNLTGDLTDYRGAYLFATTNTTYQTTYKIAAEL